MSKNTCVPFYEPGGHITGLASVALTGKTFVAITADRDATHNAIVVGKPTAAGRVFGVIAHDAAQGKYATIIRGPGFVVPVTAAGDIAAFAEVQVNADGQVVTLVSGEAVGFAVTAALDTEDAQIALY